MILNNLLFVYLYLFQGEGSHSNVAQNFKKATTCEISSFWYFSAVSNLAYCNDCYLFQIFHVDIFIYLFSPLGKHLPRFQEAKSEWSPRNTNKT